MVKTLWSTENMEQFSSWAKVLKEGQKIKEVAPLPLLPWLCLPSMCECRLAVASTG